VDVEKYGSSFMAWWLALQPEWRIADDGSFNYEVPKDEEWLVLHKGGAAGLYTVVVALSWWVRALTPEIVSFRAWGAVHDVQWVIEQISTKFPPASKKPQCEDSGSSGISTPASNKRQREDSGPSGKSTPASQKPRGKDSGPSGKSTPASKKRQREDSGPSGKSTPASKKPRGEDASPSGKSKKKRYAQFFYDHVPY
jgi:hypothetical protein